MCCLRMHVCLQKAFVSSCAGLTSHIICCSYDWCTTAYSNPLFNWVFQACWSARLPLAGDGVTPAASWRPPGALGRGAGKAGEGGECGRRQQRKAVWAAAGQLRRSGCLRPAHVPGRGNHVAWTQDQHSEARLDSVSSSSFILISHRENPCAAAGRFHTGQLERILC